jgi:hypothetical protein
VAGERIMMCLFQSGALGASSESKLVNSNKQARAEEWWPMFRPTSSRT